jgi:hypothetical protein
MTLSVSFKGARMFPRNCGYKYSDVRMCLLKVEDDHFVYIKSCTDLFQRDAYMTHECLEPGNYLFYTEVDWVDDSYTQEYQITSYCEQQVYFSTFNQAKEDVLRLIATTLMTQKPEGTEITEKEWGNVAEASTNLIHT